MALGVFGCLAIPLVVPTTYALPASLVPLALVLVGAVGLARAGTHLIAVIASAALLVVFALLAIFVIYRASYFGYELLVVSIVALLIGVLGYLRNGGNRNVTPHPSGYTQDGQPIYPVVGYTPDGQPVTADRAVGYANPRTNSLAIVALVLGLVFPLAAIPVGHVSLGQIGRTGEQGRGLAIAGLVLGYLTLAIWVIVGGFLVLSNM